MHPLEFRLFGGFEITARQMKPPKFPTRKALALFVYLALHPDQPLARTTLAALLWPDANPDKAAHSLRQALSLLRRVLRTENAPAPIKSTRHDVTFVTTPEVWIDVLAFENNIVTAPDTVVELYRGDLLVGFNVNAAAEYDSWLSSEQERLRVLALQARDQLAETAVSQGNYAQAQQHLRQALRIDSWHEAAHRALMRVLVIQGDSTAAIAQYERCSILLQEGLGVEPLPITTQLYEQIRAGTFISMSPSYAGNLYIPFVGRRDIHAQMVTQFRQAHSQTQLILIAGSAGRGKTRLVEEFGRYAQAHGALLCLGRCYEFGVQLPYQPLVEAMRSLLMQRKPQKLDAVWYRELSRLLPEIVTDSQPHAHDDGARQRLFSAAANFFASYCPLVIALDDLHWADSATLDLLQYLIRSGMGNILIVGCYRPEEIVASHPLTRLRRTLNREHRLTHLQLEPLTVADVSQIAATFEESAPHFRADFARFLWRESEGNPFFLTELLFTLQELEMLRVENGRFYLTPHWHTHSPKLSESMRDLVLGRVERLSPDSYEALQVTAVIGSAFDLDLLQRINPTISTKHLAEWRQRHLIRPLNSQYDFAHDKIREVVYELVTPKRARRLHHLIATALTEEHGDDLSAVAPQLAHHFYASHSPDKVLPHLLEAARQAETKLAFDFVIQLCSQALELSAVLPQQEMRFRQLRLNAYQVTVQLDGAFAETERLLALAMELGDGDQLLQSVRQMARTYCLRGEFQKARTLVDEMLPIMRRNADPVSIIYLLHLLAMLFYENITRQQDSIVLLDEAIGIAAANSIIWMQALATIDQSTVYTQMGNWSAAINGLESGMALLRQADKRVHLPHGLLSGAELWHLLGQYDLAQAWLDEGLQLIEELETHNHRVHSLIIKGKLALSQRQLDEAEAAFNQVLRLSEQQGRAMIRGEATYNLGRVALLRGLYGQARMQLSSALQMVSAEDPQWAILAQAWLARAYLEDGHVDEALGLITAVIETARTSNTLHMNGNFIYSVYAQALIASGQTEVAIETRATAARIVAEQAASLPNKYQFAYLDSRTAETG
ncbi:MAG: AAA family ATPase [Chloroflexi bacterium]|nr:AAA family ATPase [Chloroflexota bacterium]